MRVICGCSLGAGLRALWSHTIAAVLSLTNSRHYSSISVSSTIHIQLDTSYTQNYNKLICARPYYSLRVCHITALPFDLKPPIPIYAC